MILRWRWIHKIEIYLLYNYYIFDNLNRVDQMTNNFENSCPICLEDLTDDIYRVKHFECNYYLHSKCYKMINKCLYCTEPFNDKVEFYYRYLNNLDRDLYDSVYFDYLNDYIHRSILISPENGKINLIKLILIIIQSFIISLGIIMPNIIIIFTINQLKIINIKVSIDYPFFIMIQIMITMFYIHAINVILS